MNECVLNRRFINENFVLYLFFSFVISLFLYELLSILKVSVVMTL